MPPKCIKMPQLNNIHLKATYFFHAEGDVTCDTDPGLPTTLHSANIEYVSLTLYDMNHFQSVLAFSRVKNNFFQIFSKFTKIVSELQIYFLGLA